MTKTLPDAFATFERTAWRLEGRDTYRVADYDDALAAFLAGRPMPPRTDGWAEVVQSAVARSARISRTRLVGHPITDYTRFEFTLYPENVAWGEDIQVVDRTWLDASWAAAPDVWLFDDQVAFHQQYTDLGEYLGAEEIDPGPVAAMRRLLSTYAVPLAEYRLSAIPAPRPADAIPTPLPRVVDA